MGLFDTEWSDLKAVADQFNIHLDLYDYKPPRAGCYKWFPHPKVKPRIGLAYWILNNPVLTRCVFYEELGHHLTATESRRIYQFTEYCELDRNAAELPIIEQQALRWAACRLIKLWDIKLFIADGGGTLKELAERCKVTDELAQARLDSLKASNLSLWKRVQIAMIDREAGFNTGNYNISGRKFHFEKYKAIRVIG